MDIADALKEKGYEVDRRRVHLPEPIKETGDYTVSVRLHRDVSVDIPVAVTGEGGAQTAGATQEAAAAPAGGEAASAGETNEAKAPEASAAGAENA